MFERIITDEIIEMFRTYLICEERSSNTIEKYLRDVSSLRQYVGERAITKESVIDYKRHIIDAGYKVRSVNSMLASINSFFTYMGWNDLKVKALRLQREVYCQESMELTRQEYVRLCNAAKKKNKERLSLLLQTICSTGIRVSELQFFTVEAVRNGEVVVSLKGKTRTVLIACELQKKLLEYIAKQGIQTGPVFVTSGGRPISRTNIWREMKQICEDAKVDSTKVFPHNLRHLYARTFYGLDKDIAKLSDVLGHSSIETTRIYVTTTIGEHRKCIENMHLVI